MKKISFSSTLIACLSLIVTACSDDVPSSGYYDSGTMKYEKQKVGKPYQVKGVWYTPRYETDYDETGLASWYGDYFHGRDTANGEPFNMNSISAAHKTLPLPSYVEVTNLDNGRKLYVRVNDRGPFVDERIIDLSKRAAELLGSKATGLARVRVRQVDPPRNVVLLGPEGQKVYGKETPYKNHPSHNMYAGKQPTTKQVTTASITPAPIRQAGKQNGEIYDMPKNTRTTTNTQQVALYNQSYFNQMGELKAQPQRVPVASPVMVQKMPASSPVKMAQKTTPDPIAAIVQEQQGSLVYGNAGNTVKTAMNNTNSLVVPYQDAVQNYKVQVGVFSSPQNVDRLTQKISHMGDVSVQKTTNNAQSVALGPYKNLQMAQNAVSELQNMGITGVNIVAH